MIALTACTMGFSALLMFLVQPMVSKLLLPALGGTPAVWNTVVMSFQLLLLAGYGYVYVTSRYLKPSFQAALHIGLLLLSLLFLPLSFSLARESGSNPTTWLIGVLLAGIGLPFALLSAHTSLLSKWFAANQTTHTRNPYVLFAASNGGSLAGLLLYPALLEPLASLSEQKTLWSAGYCLLVMAVGACFWFFWHNSMEEDAPANMPPRPVRLRNAWYKRGQWVALSFIPTALMLAITTHITTDIAPIPLLWVVPLALYLISFMLAFAQPQLGMKTAGQLTLPVLLPLFLFLAFKEYTLPWWPWLLVLMGAVIVAAIRASNYNTDPQRDLLRIGHCSLFLLPFLVFYLKPVPYLWLCAWYLLAFLLVAITCHGRLNQLRPSTALLPEFYCFLAFGGALGGVFVSFVAPLLFHTLLELPLLIALCFFFITTTRRVKKPERELVPFAVAMFAAAMAIAVLKGQDYLARFVYGEAMRRLSLPSAAEVAVLVGLMVIALCSYRLRRHPLGLGVMGLMVMLGAQAVALSKNTGVRFQDRNFFGHLEIYRSSAQEAMVLSNGTTQHGIQYLSEEYRLLPTSYYSWQGPLGEVVQRMRAEGRAGVDIAAIGLGAGTVACLAEPYQRTHFYEINPMVVSVAQNPDLFTFLRDCPGKKEIILGDARLSLEEAPASFYPLMILDAFNSDAIPQHLLTIEALDLYLSKLAPQGILAYHISNRHLDLEPVVGNLASARGLSGVVGSFNGSSWVFVARDSAVFASLAQDARFRLLAPSPQKRLWTDDYTNILSILNLPRLW